MARLPIPQTTVSPRMASSGRRAQASDFGPDMSGFAQGLSNLAVGVQAHQEKKEQFDLQRDMAKASSDVLTNLHQRELEAPLGAPEFTKTTLDEFDKYANTMVEDRRKAGYSAETLGKFEGKLAGLRLDIQQRAMGFEAKSRGAKAVSDTQSSLTNFSQVASMDPTQMAKSEAEWKGMVDALPINAIEREKLYVSGQQTIRESAGMGLARQNPGGVIGSLAGPAAVGGTRESYYAAVRSTESSGDPNAKNPNSSATGLYQFTDGTWAALMAANPNAGLTADGRRDPLQQEIAMRLFTNQNAATLERDGLGVTNGNLYALHFLGSGDGPKVLKAPDGVRVASLVSGSVIAANPFLKDMTAADFKAWTTRKSGGGVARPIDGQTGNPVLDALDADQRARVLSAAYTEQNRGLAGQRAELQLRVENASAALLETGEFSGDMPTRREFITAYPNDPVQGEIAWREFEATARIGEKIAEFKAISTADIISRVEELKPKDTSSPTYATELKAFQSADAAAKSIIKQRTDDPAGYARRHFPAVQAAAQAFDQAAPQERPEATRALVSAANAAYDAMGLPANARSPLPKVQAEAVVDRVKDTNLGFDERVNALLTTVLATPDPEQRMQIFEQLVRADSDLGKFQAAVEAQARGDTGAARRLFQAGLIDPDKTPLKSSYSEDEIKLAISDNIMAEGQIGDTTYGFSDNVTGDAQRAVRDGALINNAVKYELSKNGGDLDAAVEQVKRDVYGRVSTVRSTNINAVVPEGTDANAFQRGAQARTADIRVMLQTMQDEPRDGEEPGAAAVRTAMSNLYREEIVDNGAWRSVAGGYAFFDTASGLPIPGPDGKPYVLTLEEILSTPVPQRQRGVRPTQDEMRPPWERN